MAKHQTNLNLAETFPGFGFQKPISILLLLTAMLNFASAAWAVDPETVSGNYQITDSEIPPKDIDEDYDDADLPTNLAPVSPWAFPVFTNTNIDHGVWIYANETGRVRTYAVTGHAGSAGSPALWAKGELTWNGSYTRTTNSKPKFTINESWLGVSAGFEGIGLLKRFGTEVPPFADMLFLVKVCRGEVTGGYDPGNTCWDVFRHHSRLQGIGDELSELVFNDGKDVTDGSNPYEHIEPYRTTIGGGPPGNSTLEGWAFVIPKTIRDIDLDKTGIRLLETYTVTYIMIVSVGEDSLDLHYAEAILGDPLDVDAGGFSFETLHPRAESSAQFCEHSPDPARFSNHGNGTVTDTHTGLMWQRCALGYTLDDNATAADLSDDLCVAGVTVDSDWQTALQNADSDISAGYDDWLLPNVKQLESLVELSCLQSTIDSLAFPDTPQNGFWSSTPAHDGERSWQVSFSSGDLSPIGKVENRSVRVVRNSGATPVTPANGLTVVNASLAEGDSNTAAMNFLLTLTRPASTDVTVDYETLAFTATPGVDYETAIGNLTIPAGEINTTIAVTINGDTEIETDETLQLVLSNVSSGVYFANSVALGTIIDDEPRISVNAITAEQAEGDIGTQNYAFIISLDKPATIAASVDYTTLDGTALAGEDYVAINGTAVFNIGDSLVPVMVGINGDPETENDETFQLVLSNAIGAVLSNDSVATAIIGNDDSAATYQALNDTGVTYCADAAGTLLTCPQPGFAQQDGEFGRDVTDNDPSDGLAGFSFTKLDSAGVPLANQDTSYQYVHRSPGPLFDIWDCVQDQVTALTWEIKTDVVGDLRHFDWAYSWYNSTGLNNGGDVGTENSGVCVDSTSCDTEKYIAAVNAASLCGYNDWRLPTVDELYTLAVSAAPSAAALRGLDSNYFPFNGSVNGSSSQGYTYWSANTAADQPQSSWALEFQSPDPHNIQVQKTLPMPVRLVRGGL